MSKSTVSKIRLWPVTEVWGVRTISLWTSLFNSVNFARIAGMLHCLKVIGVFWIRKFQLVSTKHELPKPT